MPLVPLSAVAASQARPQETGLSALWAKIVTEALLKFSSGGFSLLLEVATEKSLLGIKCRKKSARIFDRSHPWL